MKKLRLCRLNSNSGAQQHSNLMLSDILVRFAFRLIIGFVRPTERMHLTYRCIQKRFYQSNLKFILFWLIGHLQK